MTSASEENIADLQYRLSKTDEWIKFPYNQAQSFKAGQGLYLKGNNPDGFHNSSRTPHFNVSSGDVSLKGNIMSLLNNDSGENVDAIPNNNCFEQLFSACSGITSVDKDFLPATTLTEACYKSVFIDCINLKNTPDLPATNLAKNCYQTMFRGCSSLTLVCELPATTLFYECYENMFNGCTSLTTAPELWFNEGEFYSCVGMFANCSSLNSIKIHLETNFDLNALASWVDGVAASGTFYYKGKDTTRGKDAIPTGWIVEPNW